MKTEYSDNEIKLLSHFLPDFSQGGKVNEVWGATPILIYHAATYKAFTYPEKYDDDYITALRIALRYLDKGIYRLTPEFETGIGHWIDHE